MKTFSFKRWVQRRARFQVRRWTRTRIFAHAAFRFISEAICAAIMAVFIIWMFLQGMITQLR